jgi:putative peptidoglycan lipid II flippase
LSPVLLNIGIISGAFLLSKFFQNPSEGIAWGVLLGGILQIAIQIPILVKEGFLPRLNFHFNNEAVKKIGRLMLPSIYGSAVYQINLLAITLMASFLPTGAVSYLWYADRVIEFPLGIFAISFATVALSTLSGHAARQDLDKMKKAFCESLSMIWLINIPAAVGLAVLSKPVIALLFCRGGFTEQSTMLTAQTLQCFALGLPFVSGTRLTATAFYAVQEAKKPVRAANIAVLVNIVMAAILFYPLQHRGLALGVSLGSAANFLINIRDYRKQVGPLGLHKLLRSSAKIFVAAALMGATLVIIQHYWDWTFAPSVKRMIYVFSLIGLGSLVYLIAIMALRVEEVPKLLGRLRIKK